MGMASCHFGVVVVTLGDSLVESRIRPAQEGLVLSIFIAAKRK